jgi:dTDP-4-dehydrorhamnose reductase
MQGTHSKLMLWYEISMNKKKGILAIGAQGLVGSRVIELLASSFTFENHSRRTGFDITDAKATLEQIASSQSSLVLHMAAKTDVERCEQDRSLGNRGETWMVNVEGVRNVVNACERSGKQLIYVSTDFVFGNQVTPEDGFSEQDVPCPMNWYGQTKYEAEKIVQQMRTPWLIIRIAYPYRAKYSKTDFVRTFLTFLQHKKPFRLVVDHIMNPTFIDDIAFALDILLQQQMTGIYHIAGSQPLSPYEAGLTIAQAFNLDRSLIEPISCTEYFRNRAPRPSNLTINIEKACQLGVRLRTFREGLREVKEQM